MKLQDLKEGYTEYKVGDTAHVKSAGMGADDIAVEVTKAKKLEDGRMTYTVRIGKKGESYDFVEDQMKILRHTDKNNVGYILF